MCTGKTVGFCVLRFHEYEQMETFLVHSLTWTHGVSRWSRTLWTRTVHTHSEARLYENIHYQHGNTYIRTQTAGNCKCNHTHTHTS